MAKRRFVRPPALPLTAAAQPYLGAPSPLDYVRQLGQPNSIINGQMDVWQRGTSFASLGNGASQVGADKFRFQMVTTGSVPAVVTYSQSADVPTPQQAGVYLNYSAQIKFTTAANALSIDDYAILSHTVEGYDYRQLVPAPMTLSFWVKSSIAGTFSIKASTVSGSNVYLSEYRITNPNTWEKKSIVIPAVLLGSGLNWTNGQGIAFNWWVASNLSSINTPNVWHNLNTNTSQNQSGLMTTVNSTFQLAGVKLEPGVIATPFQPVSFVQEFAKCLRYCYTVHGSDDSAGVNMLFGTGATTGVNSYEATITFPVPMRTAPTSFSLLGTMAHWNFTNTVGAGALSTCSQSASLSSKYASLLSGLTTTSPFAGGGLFGWFEGNSPNSSDIFVWDADF